MMRQYYETPPQTGLFVPAHDSVLFPIRHPNKVRLAQVRVQQTSGGDVDFRIDIFNKEVDDTPGNNDTLARVTPVSGISSDSPGNLVHHFPDQDIMFVNKD